MNRIAVIVRHELTDLARDGLVRVALAVVVLLVAVAVVSGTAHHRRMVAERSAAGIAERERWDGQPAKNSHEATHYGVYVFKSPAPLALIERGVESFVGVGVWLEAHRTNLFRHRPIEDVTSVSRFGELTAALSVQILCPLLVILAGYGLVAGERDRGTWRLLLSSGTSPQTLIAGKVAALMAAIVVVGLPLATAAAVAVTLSGVGAADWMRSATLVLASAAYLAGWALLTVGVSAWARTARAALIALLMAWFVGCVVGPKLAGALAALAYPVPSQVEFQQALERDIGPHSIARVEERKARILREYGVSRTEELPIDWRGITLQDEEERTSAIFERHFTQIFDTYRAQNRLLQVAGLAVPVLAVQALSQAAAGTDIEHHRLFSIAAERHRREIQRLMNADVTAHDREGTDYKADPSLWRTVPPFEPPQPAFHIMLAYASSAAIALAGWIALASLTCVTAARRLMA